MIKVPSNNMHCLRILILPVANRTVEKFKCDSTLPRKVNGSTFNSQILQIREAVTIYSFRVRTLAAVDINA